MPTTPPTSNWPPIWRPTWRREIKTRFGEWFCFIITSDHPLRPQVWWGPLRYDEPDCQTNTRYLATEVPLIAVGAAAPDLTGLATNLVLMNRLAGAP